MLIRSAYISMVKALLGIRPWGLLCVGLQALASQHLALARPQAPNCTGCTGCGTEKPAKGLLQWKSVLGGPGVGERKSLASMITPHSDSACNSEVGTGRLQQYSSMSEFCDSDSGASFACAAKWNLKGDGVARSTDYLCRGSHLQLSLQSGQPVKIYGRGSGCQWNLKKDDLQLVYFLFSEDRYVPLELHNGSAAGQCAEDLGSTTLLLYSEADYWNPYINQAQAIMAYVSAAALDLDLANTRVLFTSPPPENRKAKMVPLISGLFSKGGATLMPTAQPRLVCVSDIVVPIGGHASFIRKNAGVEDPWAGKCKNAPLLHGYGSFFLDSFGVTPKASSAARARIVVLVRKPSEIHPEPFKRSITNADDVEHALKADDKILTSDTTRLMQLSKEAERRQAIAHVLTALKKELAQSRALTSPGGGPVEVIEASPETLSIAEQAELFANADIVIAAHSAALAWMSVMPRCAQVLEFCAAGNFQFVNYAKLAGMDHVCLPGVGGWGTESFQADVKNVVQEAEAAGQRRSQCLRKQQ